MKIAVTSQNFRTVTAHAGKARKFIIYSISPQRDVTEIDRLSLPKDMAMHAYNGQEPHPIKSVDGVVTGGCGDGFHERMSSMGLKLYVTQEKDPSKAALIAYDVWHTSG